jgi:sec-independent protein translocase protein TatA
MTTGLLTPSHVMILLIAVLIVLGPKRLPQAGRSLGRGFREFKDGITGRDDHAEQQLPAPARSAAPAVETVATTADQAPATEPPPSA